MPLNIMNCSSRFRPGSSQMPPLLAPKHRLRLLPACRGQQRRPPDSGGSPAGKEGQLKLSVKKERLVLTLDEPALQAATQLDGCYVVESDLKANQADAQTIHDRYKDLAYVERDFRTLKTGHLEFRPWFVCTEDNTQAHP